MASFHDRLCSLRANKQLQQSLETFEEAAQNVKLVINLQKTNNQTARNSDLGNQAAGHVNSFVYLGFEVNKDNDISLEIKRRIHLENKTYFGLIKLMRSRTISHRLKCQRKRWLDVVNRYARLLGIADWRRGV